jgi:hypothetical protein
MKNLNSKEKVKLNKGSDYYKMKADSYEGVLLRSGLSGEQIITLMKVLDLESITDVHLSKLFEMKKSELKIMCKKAIDYVDYDYSAGRVQEKLIFVGEIDNEDIKKLIVGYYMSICASLLCEVLGVYTYFHMD